MIIFISCGKDKRVIKCEAEKMYTGNYFNTLLSYAKSLRPNKIYILSAKYGVLELSDIIEPYDMFLSSMSKEDKLKWRDKVLGQLKDKDISSKQKPIFLCGRNYYELVSDYFDDYEAPFTSVDGGMGSQISWMKNKMKKKLF